MICVILPVCISWESYPRKINQMKCAFCRYPVNSPPQQQKDSPSLKVKSPPVAIISFNTSFTRRLHKTKTSDRHRRRFDLQWWRVYSKDVINWKDPKYHRIVPELFSIVRNLPILHFYLDLKGRLRNMWKNQLEIYRLHLTNITRRKSLWFRFTQNDHNLLDINKFYFI